MARDFAKFVGVSVQFWQFRNLLKSCYTYAMLWRILFVTLTNSIRQISPNFDLKLWKVRSRLYRRRFLRVNTRWKALVEIYTMHSFAPFWNRIPLHRSLISIFSSKIANFFSRLNNWISDFFQFFRRIFCEILMNFFPDSRQTPEKSEVCRFSNNFAKTS